MESEDRPTFLVTNDDGIEVYFLRALVNALSFHGNVYVAAPKKEQPEGALPFSSQEEQIAYLVNVTLDGNDEALNAVPERVIRGKAKAMLAKIKRGSLERPPMPETSSEPSTPTETSSPEQENEEQLILRLVKAGVDGNMDEINALDNKVLRGKIKSAIVKEKRGKK